MATLSSLYTRIDSFPIATISASTTLSSTDPYRYWLNATGGNIVLTLPLAASSATILHTLKRIDSTANTVTVIRSGSDLIDGETSFTLQPYEAVTVEADGVSNWFIS